MSGGYFDYVDHRISYEIIEKLDEIINNKSIQSDYEFDKDKKILTELIDLKKDLTNISRRLHKLDYFLEGDIGKDEYLKFINNQ